MPAAKGGTRQGKDVTKEGARKFQAYLEFPVAIVALPTRLAVCLHLACLKLALEQGGHVLEGEEMCVHQR